VSTNRASDTATSFGEVVVIKEMSSTSPGESKPFDRPSRPRDPNSIESKIALIKHNIEIIKAAIAYGTHVDPMIVERLELQLADFEKRNLDSVGRSRSKAI
jgi:hypothetical protein